MIARGVGLLYLRLINHGHRGLEDGLLGGVAIDYEVRALLVRIQFLLTRCGGDDVEALIAEYLLLSLHNALFLQGEFTRLPGRLFVLFRQNCLA